MLVLIIRFQPLNNFWSNYLYIIASLNENLRFGWKLFKAVKEMANWSLSFRITFVSFLNSNLVWIIVLTSNFSYILPLKTTNTYIIKTHFLKTCSWLKYLEQVSCFVCWVYTHKNFKNRHLRVHEIWLWRNAAFCIFSEHT